MDLARSSLPPQTLREPRLRSPRRWLDHRAVGTASAAVALIALLGTVFALLPAPGTTKAAEADTPVHSDAALAAAALAGEFNVFDPPAGAGAQTRAARQAAYLASH